MNAPLSRRKKNAPPRIGALYMQPGARDAIRQSSHQSTVSRHQNNSLYCPEKRRFQIVHV